MWRSFRRRASPVSHADYIMRLSREVGIDVVVEVVKSPEEVRRVLPHHLLDKAEYIFNHAFVKVKREKGQVKILLSPNPPSKFDSKHAIAMAYILSHMSIIGPTDVTMPLLSATAHFVGAVLFGPRYWEEAKEEWSRLAELSTRKLAIEDNPLWRITIAAQPLFEDEEFALELGRRIVSQPTPENVARAFNTILKIANVYARADPTRKYVIITLGANPE